MNADRRTALLVTGSREWRNYEPIKTRLALYPEGTILLHGDCGHLEKGDGDGLSLGRWVGADKIAGCVAGGRFNVWPLPYFSDLKKAGGHARNGCLVNLLVALARAGFQCSVEAFPIGVSPGTRGCITKAEAAATLLMPTPLIIRVTEGD